MTLNIGDFVQGQKDSYLLTGTLGRPGQVAAVFLGRAQNEQRAYAVKVLRPGARGEVVERFFSEATTLSRMAEMEHNAYQERNQKLSPAWILGQLGLLRPEEKEPLHVAIRLHDQTLKAADKPALIVELAPAGKNVVEDLLTGGRPFMTAEDGYPLALALAAMLSVAHTGEILYDDMKLDNLFWDEDKSRGIRLLRVIDWNVVSSKQDRGDAGIAGDWARYGALLHHLFTGDRIGLDREGRIIAGHVGSASVWSQLPRGLQMIIEKSLRHNADRRYHEDSDLLAEMWHQFQLLKMLPASQLSDAKGVLASRELPPEQRYRRAIASLSAVLAQPNVEPKLRGEAEALLTETEDKLSYGDSTSFRAGLTLLRHDVYRQALDSFSKALQDMPQDARARRWRWVTQLANYSRDAYIQQKSDLEKVIADLEQGQYTSAVRRVSRIWSEHRDKPGVSPLRREVQLFRLSERAQKSLDAGDTDSALAELEKMKGFYQEILEQEPPNLSYPDLDELVANLEEQVRVVRRQAQAGEEAKAARMQGDTALRRGHFLEAVIAYRHALAWRPDWAEVKDALRHAEARLIVEQTRLILSKRELTYIEVLGAINDMERIRSWDPDNNEIAETLTQARNEKTKLDGLFQSLKTAWKERDIDKECEALSTLTEKGRTRGPQGEDLVALLQEREQARIDRVRRNRRQQVQDGLSEADRLESEEVDLDAARVLYGQVVQLASELGDPELLARCENGQQRVNKTIKEVRTLDAEIRQRARVSPTEAAKLMGQLRSLWPKYPETDRLQEYIDECRQQRQQLLAELSKADERAAAKDHIAAQHGYHKARQLAQQLEESDIERRCDAGYREAVQHIEEARKREAKVLAICYQDPDQASEILEELRAVWPWHDSLRNLEDLVAQRQRDLAEQRERAEKAKQSTETDAEFTACIEQSVSALSRGDLTRAGLEAKAALAARPGDLFVRDLLADIAHAETNRALSKRYLEQQLEVDSAFERALSLGNQGKFDEALSIVEQALRTQPDYPPLLALRSAYKQAEPLAAEARAIDLMRRGQYRDALVSIQGLSSERVGALQMELESLIAKKEAEQAVEEALALGQQGDFGQALDVLDAALRIFPDYSPAQILRRAYEQSKSLAIESRAIDLMRERKYRLAITTLQEMPGERGDALRKQLEPLAAREQAEESLGHLIQQGKKAIEDSNIKAAVQAWTRAQNHSHIPAFQQYSLWLQAALLERYYQLRDEKKYGEARDVADHLAELIGNDHASSLNAQAWCDEIDWAIEQNELQTARRVVHQALTFHPEDPALQDRQRYLDVEQELARASKALQQGKWKEAERLVLDVTRRVPRDVEAEKLLGEIEAIKAVENAKQFMTAGRWDEARRYLSQALKASPGHLEAVAFEIELDKREAKEKRVHSLIQDGWRLLAADSVPQARLKAQDAAHLTSDYPVAMKEAEDLRAVLRQYELAERTGHEKLNQVHEALSAPNALLSSDPDIAGALNEAGEAIETCQSILNGAAQKVHTQEVMNPSSLVEKQRDIEQELLAKVMRRLEEAWKMWECAYEREHLESIQNRFEALVPLIARNVLEVIRPLVVQGVAAANQALANEWNEVKSRARLAREAAEDLPEPLRLSVAHAQQRADYELEHQALEECITEARLATALELFHKLGKHGMGDPRRKELWNQIQKQRNETQQLIQKAREYAAQGKYANAQESLKKGRESNCEDPELEVAEEELAQNLRATPFPGPLLGRTGEPPAKSSKSFSLEDPLTQYEESTKSIQERLERWDPKKPWDYAFDMLTGIMQEALDLQNALKKEPNSMERDILVRKVETLESLAGDMRAVRGLIHTPPGGNPPIGGAKESIERIQYRLDNSKLQGVLLENAQYLIRRCKIYEDPFMTPVPSLDRESEVVTSPPSV